MAIFSIHPQFLFLFLFCFKFFKKFKKFLKNVWGYIFMSPKMTENRTFEEHVVTEYEEGRESRWGGDEGRRGG